VTTRHGVLSGDKIRNVGDRVISSGWTVSMGDTPSHRARCMARLAPQEDNRVS
jgi:hypothetical protein